MDKKATGWPAKLLAENKGANTIWFDAETRGGSRRAVAAGVYSDGRFSTG